MPWKVHFGFKLSNEGRNRLIVLAKSQGYVVLEAGWDYITLNRQITNVERDTLLNVLFRTLFWQEEVTIETTQV